MLNFPNEDDSQISTVARESVLVCRVRPFSVTLCANVIIQAKRLILVCCFHITREAEIALIADGGANNLACEALAWSQGRRWYSAELRSRGDVFKYSGLLSKPIKNLKVSMC